jgi:dTMP kinase
MAEVPYHLLAGKFIVLDGPDGCGKTTQMRLLIDKLEKSKLTVKRLREPGGTNIGEQIRELLLSSKGEGMDMRCEMLLYMASRAQLVQQEIKPALARGECVIADRYASSTIAYQGGGGGLSTEAIMQVADIAVDGAWPDLTLLFDLDIETAMQRLNPLYGKSGGSMGLFDMVHVKDRIEQRERAFFERVRQSYLAQLDRWPDRYQKVDASKSVKQVEAQVNQILRAFMGTFR